MTKESLLQLLADRKAQTGTWAGLAASLGVSAQYLNDVKEGRREPGPKLLSALGLQAVTEYAAVPEPAHRAGL